MSLIVDGILLFSSQYPILLGWPAWLGPVFLCRLRTHSPLTAPTRLSTSFRSGLMSKVWCSGFNRWFPCTSRPFGPDHLRPRWDSNPHTSDRQSDSLYQQLPRAVGRESNTTPTYDLSRGSSQRPKEGTCPLVMTCIGIRFPEFLL